MAIIETFDDAKRVVRLLSVEHQFVPVSLGVRRYDRFAISDDIAFVVTARLDVRLNETGEPGEIRQDVEFLYGVTVVKLIRQVTRLVQTIVSHEIAERMKLGRLHVGEPVHDSGRTRVLDDMIEAIDRELTCGEFNP